MTCDCAKVGWTFMIKHKIKSKMFCMRLWVPFNP